MVELISPAAGVCQPFAFDAPRTQSYMTFIKALLDRTLAAAGLIVLLPLLLVIAIAVRLDGGPVFYAHARVGRHGRTFHCLKFRSMAVNGDALLTELLSRDEAAAREWAETQKLKNDVRVTRIGRFLRATSLDELPQLVNVMRQDMSLVGPRPIVTQEIHRYKDRIGFYYETYPGLTGLWQISGRSDMAYDERVALDTWYVQNWSLWLDFVILMKTIPAVVRRRGAC